MFSWFVSLLKVWLWVWILDYRTGGADGIGDWVGWRVGVGCTSTTGVFGCCLIGVSAYGPSSRRVGGPGCRGS